MSGRRRVPATAEQQPRGMLTRERAMAMVHNALIGQAEEHERRVKAVERESAAVVRKAMVRFREERDENNALRLHVRDLAARIKTQEKAIANLRSEFSNNNKRKPTAAVHFALGRGGQITRRGGRPAEDEYSEEGLLSLDDI